jgi:transcriptional regulator with XRE-family HTH domain
MVDHASNLRRLMAQQGLTLEQVIERTGLSERTVKTLLAGTSKPHARTLHRVAGGLGVPTDELFQDPSLLVHRRFDRETNPVVEEVVAESPELFAGWSEPDFDELYSRFGQGGALTANGVLSAVEGLNRKRDIQYKVDVLLESGHAELIAGIVELLYQGILVRSS